MGVRLLRKISVQGVVQGVGFRPFVYQTATRYGLGGWVLNTSGGVEMEVEGDSVVLDQFLTDLQTKAPPLARITGVQVRDDPPNGYRKFEIRESRAEKESFQPVSPDVAICPDCLRETLDPGDRRYRYPFTNCTNCGPRFTIIQGLPYDRPLTTMRDFPMCPACRREYEDPRDRRFHAQPVACPECGPQVKLVEAAGHRLPVDDPIQAAARLLREGYTLAIKGLGGFHLACDATSEIAVRTLRERKGRPHKPLAVMLATLVEAAQHCFISPEEEKLLSSPQRPVVLLRRRENSPITPLVAPGNAFLGIMLPYTPLHHLLLGEVGVPLVMTSGNRQEEPIAKDNEEALVTLEGMADYFLLHNRDIHTRCDDSVYMVADSGPQPIRRSRGYAPLPVELPYEDRPILACGAELKNTFCLTKGNYAFLSQHIGDLGNLETLEHFQSALAHYQHLFRMEPEMIAHDLHPDYLSTRFAQELSAHKSLPAIAVQHHHAHIASCLVDNATTEPVIGVAFDGTGYGTDGQIWGGEFLTADLAGFCRVGHLQYLPFPGGEAAIRNPYRLAAAYLFKLLDEIPDLPFLRGVAQEELELIKKQVERGINTPLTSSMGRLFDAVAALLGLRDRVTYEGQAAIELEAAAWGAIDQDVAPYPFSIEEENGVYLVHLSELFSMIVEDVEQEISAAIIAWRFHRTVADMIQKMCRHLAKDTGLTKVALSGGVFQNRLLLQETVPTLRRAGFKVLTHRQVPANDGGISLGQAAVAHFQAEGRKPCA